MCAFEREIVSFRRVGRRDVGEGGDVKSTGKGNEIGGVVRLANSQQSLRGTTVRAHLVGGDVVHFVDEIYGGVAF